MRMKLLNILLIVPLLLMQLACGPGEREDPDGPKLAAINSVARAWNSGDTASLDVFIAPGMERSAPDRNTTGLADYIAFIEEIRIAYPDLRLSNDSMAAGPGGGFLRWTVTGTNTGEGANPPTGKAIEITGVSYYEFIGDRIVREEVYFDHANLLAQLGIEP